jgi:hypothetical protein
MEALLIRPKNEAELNEIKKFIKQKRLDVNLINEKQKKMFAASMMTAIADSHIKYCDKEVEDIINQMKEEDEKIYGRKD